MLTSKLAAATPPERRLADLFAALGDADRRTLLAFAEFLAAGPIPGLGPPESLGPEVAAREIADPPVVSPQAVIPPAVSGDLVATPTGLLIREPIAAPNPLPRPPEERVIAAIRRLCLSYPMLDRGAMLHETAALMSAHVMQGRAASAVIDDLEALFDRHHQDHQRRVAEAPTDRLGEPGEPSRGGV